MIIYTKLWLLLESRGMKRTDLLEVVSSATLAKLGKNENVSVKVLSSICDFLGCQPGDIMENVTKEQLVKVGTELNEQMANLLKSLVVATGKTEKELMDEFTKEMPLLLEKLASGDRDFFGVAEIEKLPE